MRVKRSEARCKLACVRIFDIVTCQKHGTTALRIRYYGCIITDV